MSTDWKIAQVNRNERRWLLGFSIVLMLITTLPYILGFARAGADWDFTGFVFGVEDGNSYIGKMLSGAAGNWLFVTPYTAYPQSGVLVFLPYIILGKLASPPGQHVQLVVLFHLFRIVAGVLSIFAVYDFLAIFLWKIKWRRLGILIVAIGGGLGWLLVLLGKEQIFGSLPLEFYSPESFGFLSIYGLPHLSLARALLFWGLCHYLIGDKRQSGNSVTSSSGAAKWNQIAGIKTGLFFIGVGFAQPLFVVIAWSIMCTHLSILGLWQLLRARRGLRLDWQTPRKYFIRAIIAIVISSPIVLYTLLAFATDPFLKAWFAQKIILSPHPLHYLLAYGLLVPFVVGGAYFVIRDNPWRGSFPIVWVLLLPLLAYAPFNVQRRLLEGVWVAMVVLAVKAVEGPVIASLTRPWRRLQSFYRHVVPLFSPLVFSSLILFAGGLLAVFIPREPLFRPILEIEAFNYLNSNSQSGDVVLSAYESGNALPAWAAVRVVIGHGSESVMFHEFSQNTEQFFNPSTSESDRKRMLDALDVKYVFWGPSERELGNWDPGEGEYLLEIFNNGEYSVFEVVKE